MAVWSIKDGLLPLTQTAMRFYDRIGYRDFEGPAVDQDEQKRLVADLGTHNAMILRNRTARLYDPDVRAFGQLEWDAMLRLLDGEDPSYRN